MSRFANHIGKQRLPLNKPLVWIDLEMSGLNLHRDRILEIACIITDADLNIVAESDDLVIKTEKQVLDGMDAWCTEHHGNSGLTKAALESTVSMSEAEDQILGFIKEFIPQTNVGVLAGNSVHMDKEFLRKDMPRVLEHLHYRLVDVSTVKELLARWNPHVLASAPPKAQAHRALGDIRESIAELRFYRTRVFGVS